MVVTVLGRPWWAWVVMSAALLGLLVPTGAAEPPAFDVDGFRQMVAEGAAVPGALSLLPFERFFMLPSFPAKRAELVQQAVAGSAVAAAELASLGDRACLPYYHAIIDDETRSLAERLAAAEAIKALDGSRLAVFYRVFRDAARPLDERRRCMALLLACRYPTTAELAGDVIAATPAGDERDELVRMAAASVARYREHLHGWSADATRPAAARLRDIERLLDLGEPVVGRLVRDIVRDTKESDERAQGLYLLARMQDRTYQTQLQRMADDPSKPRRWRRMACDVLAMMGDSSRLGWLVAFAREGRSDDEVRACYAVLRRHVCGEGA